MAAMLDHHFHYPWAPKRKLSCKRIQILTTLVETQQSQTEWRKGWPLVMASVAGMSLSPLSTYHLSFLIVPLEQEFGWDRTLITSGLTVNAIVAVLFSAAIGAVIDRLGPRRIAIPGVLLFCVFFGSLSTVGGEAIHWWLLWFGIAVSSLLIKPTVWAKAIASRFDRSRGFALALMLSGTGLTGIIAPLLTGYLISSYGWRGAYIGLGAIYFCVVMPLVLGFFYGASDLQLKRPQDSAAATPLKILSGAGVKEAFSSLTFWKLAFAVLLATLIVTGGLVHFVPIITQAGIDHTYAVALTSAIGVAAMAGRMLTGFLLDRTNAKIIGGVAFVLPALAFLGLAMFAGTTEIVLITAILLGLASGAEFEIATYLTSRFFGMRNFGTLFGFIAGFAGLATGLGAPLAGFTYDRLGSYDVALWIAVGLGICASLLILSLPRYARPARATAET